MKVEKAKTVQRKSKNVEMSENGYKQKINRVPRNIQRASQNTHTNLVPFPCINTKSFPFIFRRERIENNERIIKLINVMEANDVWLDADDAVWGSSQTNTNKTANRGWLLTLDKQHNTH